MPTDLENLVARRSAILAELASLDPTKAGGKPNATGDGINVDHAGYKKSLYDELEAIGAQLAALGGGYEIISYGRT